jgi:hypothetical protein
MWTNKNLTSSISGHIIIKFFIFKKKIKKKKEEEKQTQKNIWGWLLGHQGVARPPPWHPGPPPWSQGCLLWYSCFQLPWSSMDALDGIGRQHWAEKKIQDSMKTKLKRGCPRYSQHVFPLSMKTQKVYSYFYMWKLDLDYSQMWIKRQEVEE